MERTNTLGAFAFAIGCSIISAKSTAQHTYGSFYTNDALVNYVLSENRTEDAAIVMVPGLNLSTYLFVTTPDGRTGWADLFADHGYDVYMVNDPRHDFATGGFVAPYPVPAGGPPATPGAQQGWQNDIWRRWGFGNSQGNPYSNAQFPTGSFSVFAQNYPYIGSSSASFPGAIQAVIDSTGGDVWLLAHSAGAGQAITAARAMNDEVLGMILIEPAGVPDADDFPDLNGLHMFGVYGDYIVSRNQTNRKLATEAAAVLFQNAGGIGDVVSLPEDSLVFGNSHIMMQDLNSAYVFDIIELWLQQFSSTPLGNARVAAKVFLDGPYDQQAGLMAGSLNQQGLIPASEPFTALNYPHVAGGGGETVGADVLAVQGADAIVDWVLLELRDATDPGQILATRCALVQRDGDVVDTDGTSPVSFPLSEGEYHLAIKHRNHLGAMTGTSVTLSSTPDVIDLTDPMLAVHGMDARKDRNGVMALWSGDVNFDGVLKYTGNGNDRDVILQTIGGTVPTATLNGYLQGDANMDGVVKYTGTNNDRDVILRQIGGIVPTNTRSEQIP
ncbi:MAG TPA: hypothetical protein PLB89_01530 [Flavobacteriales bacterium]|nr:hypothetical protein [Flavobacteriales bacterium]